VLATPSQKIPFILAQADLEQSPDQFAGLVSRETTVFPLIETPVCCIDGEEPENLSGEGVL
jgi:hypothetical protein